MNIILILKGIIVGIAKVIPGFSGAVLMMSFNLYDKAISAITNFFSDVKNNFCFLVNFGIGVVIGIICFSNIINYFINNYYSYTISLFIGLILGGIPSIYKNISNVNRYYIYVLFSFIVMLLLSILSINNSYVLRGDVIDYVYFFFSGILESFGTIIPGVSSTALLMIVGVYDIYIGVLSNLYNIDFIINSVGFIIPFIIGFVLGIVFLSILINYLFKNYKSFSFSLVFGICIACVFVLIIKVLFVIEGFFMGIICLILVIIGYSVGNLL